MISRRRASSSLIQNNQQIQQLFTFMKKSTSLQSTIDSLSNDPSQRQLPFNNYNTPGKEESFQSPKKQQKSNAKRALEEKQNMPSNIAIPLQTQKLTEQTQEKISLVDNSEEIIEEQRVRIYINNKLVDADQWQYYLFPSEQDQFSVEENEMDIWPIPLSSQNYSDQESDETYYQVTHYITNHSKFKRQQPLQPLIIKSSFGIYQQFQFIILPNSQVNPGQQIQNFD